MKIFGMKSFLTLLGLAALPSCSALAQSSAAPMEDMTATFSETQARAVTWTKDDFAGAKPMPLIELDIPKSRKQTTQTQPKTKADERSGQQVSTELNPSDSRKAAPFPARVTGKLFFRTPQGGSMCTAQFITSRVVLTAAHCVQDQSTGRFFNDVLFATQYNRGNYTGTYNARCIKTWRGWSNEPHNWAYQFDYAMILVDRPSAVGNLGYDYSWWKSYPKVTALGYPSAMAKGEVLQVVNAKVDGYFEGFDNVVQTSHGVKGFTFGASGGAWIAKYAPKAGKNNWVVGVNSFIIKSDPGRIWGPYLNADFFDLLQRIEGGC